MERSRRARERIARRRRRIALAACLGIATAVPLSLSLLGVTRDDLVQAAVTGGQNLSDLLDQRSPGTRTTAQLIKTKRAQHALAKVREGIAPPALLAPSPVELAKALLPPDQQPLPVDLGPPLALLQAEAPSPLSAIVSPGPGGVIGSSSPGGSGGSPPGGGGGPVTFPPQQPQLPVPPAVPEPGTWATMLLGFGLIGWRFRRGHARGARPAGA